MRTVLVERKLVPVRKTSWNTTPCGAVAGLMAVSVGSPEVCKATRTVVDLVGSAAEVALTVTVLELAVAVPLLPVALAPVCAYVKTAVDGTETMLKVPLKDESETPAMVTLVPAKKPCAAVVVMVTTEAELIVAEDAPEVAVPPLLVAFAPVCE
jgi:hypothetical protein